MPKRGEFTDLCPDLPPERHDLAVAVRKLILQTGLSCRQIEEELRDQANTAKCSSRDGWLTKSVLSDLANGKRSRPSKEKLLRELHKLARDAAKPGDLVIPWESLNNLRIALTAPPMLDKPSTNACPACLTVCSTCSEAPVKEKVTPTNRPAETPANTASPVVPVPQFEVDRHNNEITDLAWPAASELSLYITVGDLERANGLIRHVSTEATPAETANAVISCRDLDLRDAAAAIISYAGTRDADDVLQILHTLNQRDRRADADALLDRALSTPQ